ncbi:unnamed protein product, partial [marine sediment metagenome]
TDDWGVRWKLVDYRTDHGAGKYTEISKHPLADNEAMKGLYLSWPYTRGEI